MGVVTDVTHQADPFVDPGDLLVTEEPLWVTRGGGLLLRVDIPSLHVAATGSRPLASVRIEPGEPYLFLGFDHVGSPYLLYGGWICVYVDMGMEMPFDRLFKRVSAC